MPRFNLGFNQRNFNGTRPTSAAAINMGTMRGKGSTSRMFIYCTQHSKNPSECINQFINVAPVVSPYIPPPDTTILVYNTTQGSSFLWSGVTFTLEPRLSNYSYTAITTSIPGTTIPNPSNLTGVTIGNIVTSIGQYAFSSCDKLTSIIIPISVQTIGRNAFEYCTLLASVTLPTNTSFTSIDQVTFYGCTSLLSIAIPAQVGVISVNSFSTSGLTNVTIATNPQVISGITFTAGTTVTFFGKAGVNIVYP